MTATGADGGVIPTGGAGGLAGFLGLPTPGGESVQRSLRALGAALAHRGQAEQTWAGESTGLVLRTTGTSGGPLAAIAGGDAGVIVVAAVGIDPERVLDWHAAGGRDILTGASAGWAAAVVTPATGAVALVAGDTPLFYAQLAETGGLAFAAEPAALVQAELVPAEPDTARVVEFILTGGGEGGETTFFAGIRQLPAGHLLTADVSGVAVRPLPTGPAGPTSEAGTTTPAGLAAVGLALRRAERPAVRLGGGLPGAALAATIHTAGSDGGDPTAAVFSASFAPMDTTEDLYVGAVGAALGVTVHSVRVNADTLAADLPAFLRVQGEPVADLGAYVQYAVAKTALEAGADRLIDPAGAVAAYRLTPTVAGKKARREVSPASLLKAGLVPPPTEGGTTATPGRPEAALAEVRRAAARTAARLGIAVEIPFATATGLDEAELRAALPAGAPGDVRPSAPVRDWLLRLKNRIYGTFLAESFVNRPWFDQQAVLVAFEDFIKGRNAAADLFWRIWCVEMWAQEFLDPKPEEKEPARVKGPLEANADKRLEITVEHGGDTELWLRFPIRTELFNSGDDYQRRISQYVTEFVDHALADGRYASALTTPWYLLVSEKIVAISQGRSYFIWDIEPSWWARTLSKFVVRTPYGIGLGSPWTMELAIKEAGLPRILLAAGVSAAGKAIGKRGLFYQVAGHSVRAIDGPTEYSVYPANVSAKLAPANPEKVATQLRAAVHAALIDAGRQEIADALAGVVIIDANDIGRNALGTDADRSPEFFEALFADNPLGQGSEQTPLAIATLVP